MILLKSEENFTQNTNKYEKVLERRRTKKWRKVKETEKQKIIPALDETSSSTDTEILIPQKSLGSIRVEKIE